jgi:hypothetical protein
MNHNRKNNPFMKLINNWMLANTTILLLLTATACTQNNGPIADTTVIDKKPIEHSFAVAIPDEEVSAQKIQVAILLDVSNSMDGLINQAKAQLWNMVNVLGDATCTNGKAPKFEIALYEYGRTNNDVANGFVKQISPFTTDLDFVSKTLFGLTTNGGDEYCGQVMYNALNELSWDEAANNYKVIFIAGNEDFLQGNLQFTKACTLAKQKGVIVNTIYCGPLAQGISEHWNLGAECGNGSFTTINSNEEVEDIPTTYDDTIFALNTQLNTTYINYTQAGAANKNEQNKTDEDNFGFNKKAALKRAEVKSKSSVYNNANCN